MSFGTKSLKLLQGLDTFLALVLTDAEATAAAKAPFVIVQGLRTREEHLANVKAGKTRLKAEDKSKHEPNPAGFAEAADLGALDPLTRALKWTPAELYYAIAEHVRAAAIKRGVRIRWGGSWVVLNDLPANVTCAESVKAYADRRRAAGREPFIDLGHFETVGPSDYVHLEFLA